jgi:hypothetical protein
LFLELLLACSSFVLHLQRPSLIFFDSVIVSSRLEVTNFSLSYLFHVVFGL